MYVQIGHFLSYIFKTLQVAANNVHMLAAQISYVHQGVCYDVGATETAGLVLARDESWWYWGEGSRILRCERT
jgi:hypothetical protein